MKEKFFLSSLRLERADEMRRRKRLRAKLQINILNSLLNPFYILESKRVLCFRGGFSNPLSALPPPLLPPLTRATRSFRINLL
jgi:hypothetical protein